MGSGLNSRSELTSSNNNIAYASALSSATNSTTMMASLGGQSMFASRPGLGIQVMKGPVLTTPTGGPHIYGIFMGFTTQILDKVSFDVIQLNFTFDLNTADKKKMDTNLS
jgi:hypothetical protein